MLRELFLGNLVTQLMRKPQFEDPINTVNDLVDRNITLTQIDLFFDGDQYFYLRVNTTEWDHVANTMVPVKYCGYPVEFCLGYNSTHQYFIKHYVHGNKTHAFVDDYLSSNDLEVIPGKNNWWRSEMVNPYINWPYACIMTSKDWILNEVKILPSH